MNLLPNPKWMRRLKRLLIAYVLIGIGLWVFQENLLFHPQSLPPDYIFQFKDSFQEVEIPLADGHRLSMVRFFPQKSPRKGIVLYFHGNKQHIGRYAGFANNFTQLGYEVWMEDYPGYGKSTGRRTEQVLYDQARLLYSMAERECGADSIVLYGKSFGTGIAAYLASVKPCRQLLLETPYYSIPALFHCYAPIYPSRWMATWKIPLNEYISKLTIPVTIFHGTSDGVIPYSCAIQLKPLLKSTDSFVTIPGGNHHNLNDYAQFHEALNAAMVFGK